MGVNWGNTSRLYQDLPPVAHDRHRQQRSRSEGADGRPASALLRNFTRGKPWTTHDEVSNGCEKPIILVLDWPNNADADEEPDTCGAATLWAVQQHVCNTAAVECCDKLPQT